MRLWNLWEELQSGVTSESLWVAVPTATLCDEWILRALKIITSHPHSGQHTASSLLSPRQGPSQESGPHPAQGQEPEGPRDGSRQPVPPACPQVPFLSCTPGAHQLLSGPRLGPSRSALALGHSQRMAEWGSSSALPGWGSIALCWVREVRAQGHLIFSSQEAGGGHIVTLVQKQPSPMRTDRQVDRQTNGVYLLLTTTLVKSLMSELQTQARPPSPDNQSHRATS